MVSDHPPLLPRCGGRNRSCAGWRHGRGGSGMMPPCFPGLSPRRPLPPPRRCASAGMLAATLTLLAVVCVAPAGAQEAAPEEIAARLVPSVAGYIALPEGDGVGVSSRQFTLAELAGIVGADLPGPASGSTAAYMRVFATPTGNGVAMAMGFDIGIGEAADFVAGFRDAGAAEASAMPLFPDDQPPLGDVVAYEVADPRTSRRTLVTAFASGSITVVRAARDPDASSTVLRQMVRDQAALTPPTALVADVASAAPEAPRPDADVASAAPQAPRSGADEQTVASKSGRVAFVLVALGVPGWLVVRAARRRRRPALAYDDAASTVDHSARLKAPPLPPLDASSAPSWAPNAPPPPPPPLPPPCDRWLLPPKDAVSTALPALRRSSRARSRPTRHAAALEHPRLPTTLHR